MCVICVCVLVVVVVVVVGMVVVVVGVTVLHRVCVLVPVLCNKCACLAVFVCILCDVVCISV